MTSGRVISAGVTRRLQVIVLPELKQPKPLLMLTLSIKK